MKITEREFKLELDNGEGRAPGIHISDLVRVLALRFGYLEDKYADEELDPERICPGLAWEEWLAQRIPDMEFHPGEKSRDGVTGTCDGISFTGPNDSLVIHEIKFTWYSTNKAVYEQWMWLTQLKGYCHQWNTRYGRLHHYHVNADYRFDKSQRFFTHDIEFTKEELKENWKMLMNAKRYLNESVDRAKETLRRRSPITAARFRGGLRRVG